MDFSTSSFVGRCATPTHGVARLLLRGRRDAPRVALAAGAKVLSRHLERRRVARDAAAAQLERRGKLRGRRVARRRATEHARLEHVEPARGFARRRRHPAAQRAPQPPGEHGARVQPRREDAHARDAEEAIRQRRRLRGGGGEREARRSRRVRVVDFLLANRKETRVERVERLLGRGAQHVLGERGDVPRVVRAHAAPRDAS